MIRTDSAIFPEWLGWLGVTVGALYLFGIIGRLFWSPLGMSRGIAFVLFLAFVVLTGIQLLKAPFVEGGGS
ncbi:MAG: hypothetical protein ACUBOA_04785 [Candidatus Loosdrechtia sp.]|uniref:hypothetical protein n=1 Tax=Candidatus Loosdrechtia sp. TaxID=3101272 RepID=UPI003A6BFB42|nr:MAG: hypothetical protein QY305_14425 [Candidatus Jettenia sp. AMX2]